jgi:hypothetical protein
MIAVGCAPLQAAGRCVGGDGGVQGGRMKTNAPYMDVRMILGR